MSLASHWHIPSSLRLSQSTYSVRHVIILFLSLVHPVREQGYGLSILCMLGLNLSL